MARNPETREIDGYMFEVTPLGFVQGRRLFVRLSKALGPGLVALAGGAASLASLDLVTVSRDLIQNLDDAELEHMAETLGEVTRYWPADNPKAKPYLHKDARETLFSGSILLFFRWLAFACEVQFSDFFDMLRRALAAKAPAPGASTPAS